MARDCALLRRAAALHLTRPLGRARGDAEATETSKQSTETGWEMEKMRGIAWANTRPQVLGQQRD